MANCFTKTNKKPTYTRGVFFKNTFLKNLSLGYLNIRGATFIDFAHFSRGFVYSTPYV